MAAGTPQVAEAAIEGRQELRGPAVSGRLQGPVAHGQDGAHRHRVDALRRRQQVRIVVAGQRGPAIGLLEAVAPVDRKEAADAVGQLQDGHRGALRDDEHGVRLAGGQQPRGRELAMEGPDRRDPQPPEHGCAGDMAPAAPREDIDLLAGKLAHVADLPPRHEMRVLVIEPRDISEPVLAEAVPQRTAERLQGVDLHHGGVHAGVADQLPQGLDGTSRRHRLHLQGVPGEDLVQVRDQPPEAAALLARGDAEGPRRSGRGLDRRAGRRLGLRHRRRPLADPRGCGDPRPVRMRRLGPAGRQGPGRRGRAAGAARGRDAQRDRECGGLPARHERQECQATSSKRCGSCVRAASRSLVRVSRRAERRLPGGRAEALSFWAELGRRATPVPVKSNGFRKV